MSAPHRNLPLDLLRAAAVLMVLLSHIDGNLNPAAAEQAAFRPWAALFAPGWLGVPLFFVLSGFLIASLLIREHFSTGRVSVSRFLVRRGFKIYPPFYLLLGVYALHLYHDDGTISGERLLREVFFLQNYGAGGLMDVTWSLAVEEHFYLLFAALAAWLTFRHPPQPGLGSRENTQRAFRCLPVLAVGLAVLCLVLRIVEFVPYQPGSVDNAMKNTHHRIDALFIGAALAYLHWNGVLAVLWQRRGVKAATLGVIAVTLGLAALPESAFPRQQRVTWFYLLVSLAAAGVVGLALQWQPRRSLLLRALGVIGGCSYCIYLVHIPVYRVVGLVPFFRHGPHAFPAKVLAALGISVLAGIAFAHVVERPFLKLRDRWFPGRGRPAAGDPFQAPVREALPPPALVPVMAEAAESPRTRPLP